MTHINYLLEILGISSFFYTSKYEKMYLLDRNPINNPNELKINDIIGFDFYISSPYYSDISSGVFIITNIEGNTLTLLKWFQPYKKIKCWYRPNAIRSWHCSKIHYNYAFRLYPIT